MKKVTRFLKKLTTSSKENNVDVFHSSMKYCLISGQVIGLFPIMLISERAAIDKKRLRFFSWRYMLWLSLLLGQIIITIGFFYQMIQKQNFFSGVYVLFYGSSCIMSILFVRLATKWFYITEIILSSRLDEFIDNSLIFKCKLTTVLLLGLALVEHILSIISRLASVTDCGKSDVGIFQQFMSITFSWLKLSTSIFSSITGVLFLILGCISTIIWTYSQIFIVCISMFLSSILKNLNKKIVAGERQYLPITYWRKLREDYNRATRLVYSFDELFNGIVFTSFASSLYFVCLKLYILFEQNIQTGSSTMCANYPSGIFKGYEHVIYVAFSMIFVLTRWLGVSIIVAQVHTESLVVAPSLYNVPSPAYCTEVQRFVEQVHGNTVALTGLNFFYVTKELVLSIISNIVTYELVLLQFITKK